MIRIFTLFCKLNRVKRNDWDWFTLENRLFRIFEESCPACGAKGCCTFFASYERDLLGIENGKPACHRVKVRRVRCTSCSRTHAVLPSCVIAYGSYSIRFVITVLQRYVERSETVEELCEYFGISHSTLYKWWKLFQQHKKLWLGILEDAVTTPCSFLETITGQWMNHFFKRFQFSFLQGKVKKATRCKSP